MKTIRITVLALFVGALSAFAADNNTPATSTTTEKPACCVRAEKKGKTCHNPCCVEAAKEGKVCEKCLKKGHGKKKHGEHKKTETSAPVDETPAAAPSTAK